MDFRYVCLQGHTTVRQHRIAFATDDTVQAKREKSAPAAQYIWCTRNVSNLPGTHQETR